MTAETFSTQLLRDGLSESGEEEEMDLINVPYEMIRGFRKNSMLLWAFEEKQLYYWNSYSKERQIAGYTCRVKGCPARIYVRDDRTAYRELGLNHLNSHKTQYSEYLQMRCENKMKDKAKDAVASMSPYEIYMECVKEYVLFFFIHILEIS